MKQFNITLTESEIEALQICLSGMKLTLQNQIDELKENNKCVHLKTVDKKRERISECDDLFKKLNRILSAQ